MSPAKDHLYLIGLGSNMRRGRHLSPGDVIRAAIGILAENVGDIGAISDIVHSRPLGPSTREYANAACVLHSKLEPRALLGEITGIEETFGRRRSGQRWRARTLDLDILFWSGD